MPGIGRPSSLVATNGAPHWAYWRFLDGSRVYTPEQQASPLNSALISSLPADTLYAWPFFVGKQCRFNSMVFEINGGIGTTLMRFGIYRNRSVKSPYPTSRIWDSGQQSIAANGLVTLSGINQTAVASSLYWLACLTNGGARSFVLFAPTSAGIPTVAGIDDVSPNTLQYGGWRAAQAFGALPSSYPAGATRNAVTTSTPNLFPAIGVTLTT